MRQVKFLLASVVTAFLVAGCSSHSTPETIANLNGYWQIAKVEQKDGKTKTYKMSPMVDYIKIDSTQKGYRMKLSPQYDGTYKTTRDAENFTLKRKNDSLRFYYKTRMAEWRETLLFSEKDKFSVKNDKGITYTYKRYEGIPKYEDDGKK